MNIISLTKKLFDKNVFLQSLIIVPLLVIAHELVHLFCFEIMGIDAYFPKYAMTAVVNFRYDIPSLTKAIDYYHSSSSELVFAIISAPVFTLIVAYIFLFLYNKYRRDLLWTFSFNPLSLRLIGITALIPSILSGETIPCDEVVVAHFLNIPSIVPIVVSLAIGYD